MSAVTYNGFPSRPAADRNAFIALVALVWVGVLSGFGTDSFRHVSAHGLDYPLIVHAHALAFVSWLVLFTVQVGLIRTARLDIHKRLGLAAAALAALMLMLGPATAIIVDAAAYARKGVTPEFLSVQLTDMVGFGLLTGAGLLARAVPSTHKRLLVLGLIFISDAGFARFLNGFVAAPLGNGLAGEFVSLYFGNDVLMLGLGLYDLGTRRRLHPAYAGGAILSLCLQLLGQAGLHSAAWKAVSLHLIGR